ncbi:PUA domain/NOL1/NOP2/sun family [Novymonas esmeraldas]|uniref:PUA domain/NOL1/NOP2/sun family n=1 Tax=Novymonas esmeraldas TaxID=1808958 RepID=A0AAW0ENT1_9TRYP
MISLDTYARHVYRYSTPATTEHLRQTVWSPLGYGSEAAACDDGSAAMTHASLYAIPPATTNVRCVGASIESRLCDHLREAALSTPDALVSRFAPLRTLSAIGLPFCLCVQPQEQRHSSWPPELQSPPPAVVVVVDVGAAEAVLRGSDLYAPGIVTASRPFHAGVRVVVAFYVERVDAPGDGAAAAAAAAGLTSALPTGASLPVELYAPLCVDDTDGSGAVPPQSLARRRSFLVCIGSGVTCMEWRRVMSRAAHGTAVRMEWTPHGQPSRATLRALLGIPAAEEVEDMRPSTATEDLFLQNFSSMVPVALLVDHLSPAVLRRAWGCDGDGGRGGSLSPCTVLDACAAPGGKTSLLLSLLQDRADCERAAMAETATADALSAEAVKVVCCERSRARQEQLVKLLHGHFDATGGSSPDEDTAHDHSSSTSYVARVVEAHCIDANKFLKRRHAVGDDGSASPSHADSFDAVLLDPPCTGMGLRPKLMPHAQTVAAIQQSADYQRKLLDSCLRHLRCYPPASPGVLVYSTCTTTLEENEANVLHVLRTYPGVRLARATTAAQRTLCGLSAVHGCGTSTSSTPCLLHEELTQAQLVKERAAAGAGDSATPPSTDPLLVLRFMPRPLCTYTDTAEDGVGFFVAVFLHDGHSPT